MSIVINARIRGLQQRLVDERRGLTEDVRQLRNRSAENQSNGIQLSPTEQSALNTLDRSLIAINDSIAILNDISDEVMSGYGSNAIDRYYQSLSKFIN